MANVWEFEEPVDDTETYSDGTVVPHRKQYVKLNGKRIGFVEVHMHKRGGDDKVVDTSFGLTAVVFSEPSGGN